MFSLCECIRESLMYSFVYTGGRWVHVHLYACGAENNFGCYFSEVTTFVLFCGLVGWLETESLADLKSAK